MIVLSAKLLIAHLVGDFILFRGKRLKEKGRPVWASKRLLVHCLVHFVLAWIALGRFEYWIYALIICFSHYLAEIVVRVLLSKRPQWAFVTDQAFHVVLIVLISAYLYDVRLVFNFPWLTIAGLITVTFPAAKCIEVFLSQWPPTKSADKIRGLVNAGLWIGILERILIYIFIVTGHWEGIGFLLAAKSVFRFGDLTNSKDISLTEYIMVGTLLSFCLAVVTGLIVNYMLA